MRELTEAEKKEIELLHERAAHGKTLRRLESATQLLDDMVAAIQDLTGEYFGEHSNGNDPWELALDAIQTQADEAHVRRTTESAAMTPNAEVSDGGSLTHK